MPRRNRVQPNQQIVAVPQRGAWMGNRGKLHGKHGDLKWFQYGNRWIICELEYKGIRREIMGNSYTELFFLDEATAFAAGHRPCHQCRRESAKEFLKLSGCSSFSELDDQLQVERRGERQRVEEWRGLPNGTILLSGIWPAFLVNDESLYAWSFDGYIPVESIQVYLEESGILRKREALGLGTEIEEVCLATPKTTIEVLRKGYKVQIADLILAA